MNSLKSAVMVAASISLLFACGTKATGEEAGESSGATTTSAGESSTESSGGSTGMDTTATGTDTTTTTTGGFVMTDMLGDAMCDIWNPMDCPEGEKCMPYASSGASWDALKCSPLDENPKLLGDECLAPEGADGGVDDCGEGLYCYYVNAESNVGTCISFCTGSPTTPMCEANAICTIVNDGVLILCRPECDPISQDCEPPGSACYQATGTGSFTCIADKSGDAGAYLDPCTYISSCDAGLACIDGAAVPGCSSGSCCTPFCDVNQPNNCPDAAMGQVCEPYYELPDPGYEHVGICAVPLPDVAGSPRSSGAGARGPKFEASETTTLGRR